MEQIKDKLPEALLTLTSGKKNSIQLSRPAPEWLPIEYTENYNKTDLTYEFCVKLFGQLEAVKREKIPMETARQWFVEFVRKGWTQAILQKRYDALIGTKIYGIEKLDFADWVNAVEVFSEDEVQLKIKQRVDTIIQRGNYLKTETPELSEEDKRAVRASVSQKLQFEYANKRYELMESASEELRKRYVDKLSAKKRKIAEFSLQEKMKCVDSLIDKGIIKADKGGFEYQVILHHLEDYADLLGDI